MPTIADGGNATISVGVDDIITVQCPAGWVRYENPVGTIVAEFSGVRSFGPFSAAGSVKLTSVQRSVVYEVSDLSTRTNAVWADGRGAALIRPDGLVRTESPAPSMQRWRKALANVRTSQARAKIACVGDSTTTGWGAGSSTNGLSGARLKSYPTYLASILSGMGYATNTQSIWGTANLDNGATIGTLLYGAYDARVTYPSDWTSSNSSVIDSVGGRLFRSPSTVTSSLIFAPSGSVDTFIVHVVKSVGNGTLTINTDGGATAATIDCNASGAITSQTISVALGTHDVRVQRSSGGVVFVAGIEAYNSASPAIDIWNMGGPGWGSSEWTNATNAWSPRSALAYFDPDLTIINVGINNWKDTPQAIATYTANMQSFITTVKSNGGSCVLVVPFPSQTTRASVAQQASFVTAIHSLAVTNDCPIVDLTDRFTTWDVANSAGFAFNDLHPNSYGYADMAQALVSMITA